MKISLNWLKEFVEITEDPGRLQSALTNVGLNAESYAAQGTDFIFDIEVTTNRPDCLSHYGVAREVATIYRRRLKRPEVTLREVSIPAASEASVEILNPELCARYCGRVINGVRVGPSPEWMTKRLEAVGQRPINNVADITNYVLMELGQPLHAFDLSRLAEHRVAVRRAKAGERLQTLDGVERTLSTNDLVIADATRPVALAGIMGGKDSEISSGTSTVLLESAWFDPPSIRRTAKSQGLHTEASHRFERGADIEMAPLALNRTAELIVQIAGGEVLRGMMDVFPVPPPLKHIMLRRSEVQRVLGTEISWEEIERILRSLGFEVERRGTEGWKTRPPSFRLDVTEEVDLIEEIARHHGYDRMPSRLRSVPPSFKENELSRKKELKIAKTLVAHGYREIIPISMTESEENALFSPVEPVRIENPLSLENSVMRSSAALNMVRAIRWNLDRDQMDVRFYEMGRAYAAGESGAPAERRVLMLGATGTRRPGDIHDTRREFDFFDIKGEVEAILSLFEVADLQFERGGCHYFQPGSSGRFLAGNRPVAMVGELRQEIGETYKLRQKVWLAEIDLDILLELPSKRHCFRGISKYPAVSRDFSLIVPERVSYAELSTAVKGLNLDEIQDCTPVERRTSAELGGKIPEGSVSLLLRFTLQSRMHTLTSDEIEDLSRSILKVFERLDVHLRV